MPSNRRGEIDRSDIDEVNPSAPTLADVDAALYGKIAKVDSTRRAVERARFGAFKITPVGLEIGDNAQQKDWDDVGQFIFQMESGIQWMIGDWLIHGVSLRYGDIPKLAEKFGRDESTLHTYKQMCENIEYTRRRVDLSFGHHQVVRALLANEQDEALAYAAEHDLSVAAFRKLLQGTKQITAQIQPPVMDEEWDHYQPFFSNPSSASSLSTDERQRMIQRVKKMVKWWESLDSE